MLVEVGGKGQARHLLARVLGGCGGWNKKEGYVPKINIFKKLFIYPMEGLNSKTILYNVIKHKRVSKCYAPPLPGSSDPK